MELLKKHKNLVFISVMVILTTITYLNHFDNSFHFDDLHAITGNPNIRSLQNTPNFFVDGSTISSLPQNQTYRPIVTLSLAIDYWLGNGYDVFYFHFTTFILFLILGVLIFYFSKKILDKSSKTKLNFCVAAGITLFYMLHPVMAETVNYVIARSDLQSTLFVILAFVLYQYSSTARQYYLYLIPIVIGTMAKPLAIMFAPLFFCYVILFEEKISFIDLFRPQSWDKTTSALKKIVPSIVICILLYAFHQIMTPDTFSTGSSKTFNYLITQPYVIAYYFGSSIFPIHLSADTDWNVLDSIWSYQFFIGLSIIISLIYIAFYCSKEKKYYPISFGIAWFLIALLPTSSIIPLAEVMNDHRMFFPYVGLIISVGYGINLLTQYGINKHNLRPTQIIVASILLLTIYSYGTYQRNEVWHNDETLWKDVTKKSPKNGRGLMNYALTQMSIGKYEEAEKHMLEALKILPKYPYLHINLGVLYNAKGNTTLAEEYFKKAIKLGFDYNKTWYHYGRFLYENSRKKEATEKLLKSIELSPYDMESRQLLMQNYLDLEQWDPLNKLAYNTLQIEKNNKRAQVFLLASIQKISKLDLEEKTIEEDPTPEKYINLSLKYYQNKQYKKCIEASKKTLELNSKSKIAYNNICSAYNALGMYEEAIIACKKALGLDSNYIWAKNNLKNAINNQSNIQKQVDLVTKDPSEANYLNLSLLYYKKGLFEKCVETAEQGITKYPNSDKLYNNICAAYNSLKKWDESIKACKKGLAINSNNQILKNNYNLAIRNN